jgi:hypothetical protein
VNVGGVGADVAAEPTTDDISLVIASVNTLFMRKDGIAFVWIGSTVCDTIAHFLSLEIKVVCIPGERVLHRIRVTRTHADADNIKDFVAKTHMAQASP